MDGGEPEDDPNTDPFYKRDVLESLGVKGAMLASMANCRSLTAKEIAETWSEIRADHKVSNPVAVLVRRLSKKHGIKADGRAQVVPSDWLAASRSVERIRRTSRNPGTHSEPKRGEADDGLGF